mgnify:CR=1 FL=1
MEKEYTDGMTKAQRTRKKHIQSYIFKLIILAIVIVILVIMCAAKDEEDTICYKENSRVDYNVYLKENEFYNKTFLKKDNQYIASLIDYIETDFNYELKILKENISYNYSYRVEAEVDVQEPSTSKSIYNFTETMVEEKKFTSTSKSDVKINETVIIDYNKYNDLINKFISVYDLDNASSKLFVNMYIKIDGENIDFSRDANNEYIISLEIPLTTNTIAIDLNSNLIGCEETLINCETEEFCWLKVFIVLASLIEIYLVISLIRYTINSRTPEDIYRIEIARIISDYGSYIQRITKPLSVKKVLPVYVDTFNDLLEIRDTIQEPILMYEKRNKCRTIFMIPSKTDIVYVYEIKVSNKE